MLSPLQDSFIFIIRLINKYGSVADQCYKVCVPCAINELLHVIVEILTILCLLKLNLLLRKLSIKKKYERLMR
jgi:hypothetical protein